VRWLPTFVSALGAVAACASVLGIESPSDGVGSAGDGEAAAPDAEDAADVATPETGESGDALGGPDTAPLDATPADDGVDDGGVEVEAGVSALPTPGIPCGSIDCLGNMICCYGSPTIALGCMSPSECMVRGGNPAACDGPEDCLTHEVCCAIAPGGGFSLRCTTSIDCKSAIACHTIGSTCDCKAATPPCTPFGTCDGRCM
jgi:hypothetical protein